MISETKNCSLNFLLHFSKLDQILNTLKKKMTLTGFVFPKLRTLKTWIDKCLKSPVPEDPSTSNMDGKSAKKLLKSEPQHLYQIHWSLTWKFCSKKSLLLTCQILGLRANTLATNEKNPVLNRENLTIPIQMQLSQKQKHFSQFSAAFLKSRLNSKHFQLKDDPHRVCIFEVTDSKNVVR